MLKHYLGLITKYLTSLKFSQIFITCNLSILISISSQYIKYKMITTYKPNPTKQAKPQMQSQPLQ